MNIYSYSSYKHKYRIRYILSCFSEVLAERESILKLLPQTTPENITKDFKKISIYPKTR